MRLTIPIWDFYSSIRLPTPGVDDGGYRFHLSIEEKIEVAKELFPFGRPTQWNLTVSHHTRKMLNKKYNEMGANNHTDKIWIQKSERPSPNEPQAYWLYPGLILIAYISNGKQGNVHNGQLFEVEGWGEEGVALNQSQDVKSQKSQLK